MWEHKSYFQVIPQKLMINRYPTSTQLLVQSCFPSLTLSFPIGVFHLMHSTSQGVTDLPPSQNQMAFPLSKGLFANCRNWKRIFCPLGLLTSSRVRYWTCSGKSYFTNWCRLHHCSKYSLPFSFGKILYLQPIDFSFSHVNWKFFPTKQLYIPAPLTPVLAIDFLWPIKCERSSI